MSNNLHDKQSTTDAVQPLRARLSTDLLAAMKARDQATIDTLRCLLAVLDNAGAQDPKDFAGSTEISRESLTQNELAQARRARYRPDLIQGRYCVT